MSRTRLRQHRRGYTLIEVLAAFVLVGVVLPVAMQGISLSLAAAGRAKQSGEAVELARHKLAELSLTPDQVTAAGDFGTDWPAYKWAARLTPRTYGVAELAVDVTWTSRGKAEAITLTTLIPDTSAAAPTGATP